MQNLKCKNIKIPDNKLMTTFERLIFYKNLKAEVLMKFDIQSIMQQAQKMQEEVERIKKGLETITIKSEAGGGMVIVEITASGKILQIKIAPELLNSDDISMLEDLVVAAVNKAQEDASRIAADEMNKVRGMLPNIPGMNLGF